MIAGDVVSKGRRNSGQAEWALEETKPQRVQSAEEECALCTAQLWLVPFTKAFQPPTQATVRKRPGAGGSCLTHRVPVFCPSDTILPPLSHSKV